MLLAKTIHTVNSGSKVDKYQAFFFLKKLKYDSQINPLSKQCGTGDGHPGARSYC